MSWSITKKGGCLLNQTKVFTEKQLAYARSTRVYGYMIEKGEQFDSVGKYWVNQAHPSFKIKKANGVAKWHSQDISSYNNAIELMSAFFDLSYEDTVQELLDYQSSTCANSYTLFPKEKLNQMETPNVPFDKNKLSEKLGNFDKDRLDEKGRRFLKMRFLNEETIDEFAAKKLISSDDYGNLVYRISDVGVGITGHYVGAEIQGTIPRKLSDRIRENHKGEMQLERKYFKGTALNSKTNRGFLFGSVTSFKDPLKLIVTEAPLEALSFYELHKDKLLGNHWHLSLNGLKEQTLWHTAKALKEMFFQEKLTIILALNNDEKGLEAIKRIHETYQQSPQHKERYKLSLMLPDLEQGDWNEVLEVKKTGSLASRSEKEQDQQKALALFEARQKSTKEAELQL